MGLRGAFAENPLFNVRLEPNRYSVRNATLAREKSLLDPSIQSATSDPHALKHF